MSRFGLSLKQVSPKLFGLKKHGFRPLFPSAVTSIIPSVTESGSLKLDQDLASLAYKVATRFAWANAFLPVPARVVTVLDWRSNLLMRWFSVSAT